MKSQAATLNDFFDGMMRDKENIKRVTKVNYQNYWNRYVRSGFGDKLAKEISREELKKSIENCFLLKALVSVLERLKLSIL